MSERGVATARPRTALGVVPQVRRRAPLWVAVPGFLLGVLGTSVGLGVALPYAAKTGLTAGTALGVGLVSVGLALLVLAAVSLLRRTRRRWWLVTVPVMLFAVYAVVFSVSQAVAATHVPPTPLGARTPASLGLPYRSVGFAADGVRLAGWWLPSRNGAAVVLLHGAGSNRQAVLPQAAVLYRHGYGVLMYDARGHGASGGTAMDFGWNGESDLHGAVDAAAARPGVDPRRIGAVGLSMGGEEAIGAAGVDPRVRAVVAEGATNRVFGDKDWLAQLGARGQVQRGVEWLTYTFADLLTTAPVPVTLHESVAAAAPRRVLMVTAGDLPDERRAAELVRARAPGSVTVWTVPGAGHTGGLGARPKEWTSRVVGFLDANLGTGFRPRLAAGGAP